MTRSSAYREQLTEEGREAGRSLMKREKKVQGQERMLAEHLDGLERSGFCDFDKSNKRAYQKGKIKSNEQSKEGGQPKKACGKERDARQSQKALEKSIVNGIV